MNKTMDTQIKAIDVAKYFLNKANQEGDLITNLKMQKLLYYAQAWYLVNFNTPLFKEAIAPWQLGPVVEDVYHEFKKFKSGPIVYKTTGEESKIFTKKQLQYLDEFCDAFLKFSAHELVNMSHNETPWKDAFANSEIEISHNAMKQYYTQILRNVQKRK